MDSLAALLVNLDAVLVPEQRQLMLPEPHGPPSSPMGRDLVPEVLFASLLADLGSGAESGEPLPARGNALPLTPSSFLPDGMAQPSPRPPLSSRAVAPPPLEWPSAPTPRPQARPMLQVQPDLPSTAAPRAATLDPPPPGPAAPASVPENPVVVVEPVRPEAVAPPARNLLAASTEHLQPLGAELPPADLAEQPAPRERSAHREPGHRLDDLKPRAANAERPADPPTPMPRLVSLQPAAEPPVPFRARCTARDPPRVRRLSPFPGQTPHLWRPRSHAPVRPWRDGSSG